MTLIYIYIYIYIYIVILNSYINKAMQYNITLIINAIAIRIPTLFYLKHLFLIYIIYLSSIWIPNKY